MKNELNRRVFVEAVGDGTAGAAVLSYISYIPNSCSKVHSTDTWGNPPVPQNTIRRIQATPYNSGKYFAAERMSSRAMQPAGLHVYTARIGPALLPLSREEAL
jgi:hypothetical protein